MSSGDTRVYFQVHGLDAVYKLKLSPRSAFRHLFSHVPLDRGPGRREDARIVWNDTVLQADLTPRDYGMAPGEASAHVLQVTYVMGTSPVSAKRSPARSEMGHQADDSHHDRGPMHGHTHDVVTMNHRSVSTRSDDSMASSSASGTTPRGGLAYFSRKPQQQQQQQQQHHDPVDRYSSSAQQPPPPELQQVAVLVPSYPTSEDEASRGATTVADNVQHQQGRAAHHPPVPVVAAAASAGEERPPTLHTPVRSSMMTAMETEVSDPSAAPVVVGVNAQQPPPEHPHHHAQQQQQQQHHRSRAEEDASLRPAARDDDGHHQHHPRHGGIGSSGLPKRERETTTERREQHEVSSSSTSPPQFRPEPQHHHHPREQHAASSPPRAQPQLQAKPDRSDANGSSDHRAAELEQALAAMRQERERAELAVESLTASVEARDKRLETMAHQLREAQSAAASRSASASNAAVDVQELERLRAQLKQSKHEAEHLRAAVREKDVELLEAARSAQTSSDERQAQQIQDLKRQLREVDSQVAERDSLRQKNRQLETQLEQMIQELASREHQLDAATTELSDLRTEYDEAMAEMRGAVDSLNAQNEALLAETAQASQVAIQKKTRNDHLQAEAAQLPELKKRITDLERELATASSAAQLHMQQELDKWQKTATDLNATVQSLRQEVITANDAVAKAHSERDRAVASARNADDSAQDAEQDLKRAGSDVKKLRDANRELEASVVECNNVIIAAQREASRLRHQVLELQQREMEAAEQRDSALLTSSHPQQHPSAASQSSVPRWQHPSPARSTGGAAAEPPMSRELDHRRSSSAGHGAWGGPPHPGSVTPQQRQQRSGSQSTALTMPTGGSGAGPHASREPVGAANQRTAVGADPGVPSQSVPPLTPRPARARIPGQTPIPSAAGDTPR